MKTPYERNSTLTKYTVSQISLEELNTLWCQTQKQLPWNCIFVTPFWLQTVVKHLGTNGDPQILIVTRDSDVVGIAPFALRDKCAYFLGLADVCDYQDVIIAPGQEEMVGRHLLAHLSQQGIEKLDLQALRQDATACKVFSLLEQMSEISITRLSCDVTYETALPIDWDGYLMQLSGKQRHEVRRKIRRLEAYGTFAYHMAGYEGNLDDAVTHFLRLFHLNRKDKAEFMDDIMSAYFRSLIERLARQQILRLYFLVLDNQPVATVLCFDYNGIRYLYNSGYDANYHSLSVGILSKVLNIQKSIEAGCRKYDFLRGAEVYKKRIGGQEKPLSRYLITL